MLYHSIYNMEWLWAALRAGEDNAKVINVVDLAGMKLSDTRGEAMDFFKRFMKEGGAHYPERTRTILIVNVPAWFSMVWSVVSAFLPARTLAKVQIKGRAFYSALSALVADEHIPREYGGKGAWEPYDSPEERELWAHVREVNARAEVETCI